MPQAQHRILLVDDHAVVRAGHRALLEASPGFLVVAEASNGEEALRLAAHNALDLAILDLELPGMSGLETCERLRRQHPNIGVVLVTVHESQVLQARAKQAGALGFVAKSASAENLIEVLMSAANGTPCFSPAPQAQEASNALAGLTAREFEILRLLARGASVSAVAENLHLSPKTVSNALTGLRTKLGVRERQGLIRFAIAHGLGSN